MSQRVAATNPPSLGTTGQADWESVPLAGGSSVVQALRERGIPATRDVLAAIAQVNGIRDFRHIPAGTALWLPRRESIAGARAQVWREAYQALTPDSLATVERDRAAATSAVRPQTTDGPRIAAPVRRGPPRQADPVDPLDIPVLPPADDRGPLLRGPGQLTADQPTEPAAPLAPPGQLPDEQLDPQGATREPFGPQGVLPGPDGVLEQAPGEPVQVGPDGQPLQPTETELPQARAAVVPPGPGPVVDPDAAARAAAPQRPQAAPNAEERMQGLVASLRAQLTGPRDRETIIGLTYRLMSSPHWTNAVARRKYAQLAGSANEWQLIADLRASGMDPRDVLRASEYVWNDESTPFDGDVSAPIRVVLAAVGHSNRGMGRLDAGFGTADASFEDALWEIIDTVGVDTANAVIASRAGANPAGMVANLRATYDPQNPGILGRAVEMLMPSRAAAPLDGVLQAAPAGSNPLSDIINTEYAAWKNPLGGFSGARRDRLQAILRMPPGTDRRAFDTANAATEARGEDLLRLFENKTREQVDAIAAAYDAGFGAQHGTTLERHALGSLDSDQLRRFQALMQGTRSDANAAARYIALALRARASNQDGMRETLRMLGSTASGTPRWQDVLTADFNMNAERAQQRPLTQVVGALASDPAMQVILRDNASPDEPVGLARRILASRDPNEISRLLKRTDGDLFNDQELAIMNQAAAQLGNTDPAANPSALFTHVSQICGPASEAAFVVRRVGGPVIEAPLYDETGRLAPAARLFFALQRGDAEGVSNLLARLPFVSLSALEASYPAVAQALGQAGAPVPANTGDVRAAIRSVLRGEERDRALRFMTGFNITSADAAQQSGDQLAAAVVADLQSRCAWLLRGLDHEREPLNERLMQFQVSLRNVLDAVAERRDAHQSTELTEAEQQLLGSAIRRLVGQRRNFETERDDLARSIQDTTILVAVSVASMTLTVGTLGAGAAPSAMLWATAMNIARVAAVGTIAGLATAPLQGGANRYVTSGAKGFTYGAFAGLGASTPYVTSVLSRVIPGTGLLATTMRNGVVMATVSGGLSAANNIGVEFASTDDALRKVGSDALRGALLGFLFAGGFAVFQRLAGNAMAAQQLEVLNDNLTRYRGARDFATMERSFAALSGGAVPPAGTVLEIPVQARAMLEQGINRHLAALGSAQNMTAAEMTQRVTQLTLYAEAAGIQIQGPALSGAMQVLQRVGIEGIPARLTETQARAFLLRTAEGLRPGGVPIARTATAAPSGPGPAPAGTAARAVRLTTAGSARVTEMRSWAEVSNQARQAGNRALPLQTALRTRQELAGIKTMLETPQGHASLATMQRELGGLSAQDVAQLRRTYVAAMNRVDQQIATSLRNEAATLSRMPVPTGDVGPFYERLNRIQEMHQTLATLRTNGMTRELFEATSQNVAAASRGIDTTLAARVRETFVNPGVDPRAMLASVRQFRDALQAQGYAETAPQTFRAFNEAIQRLQHAAAPRAAA